MKKILFITIFFIVYSSILRSVENDTEAEGLTFVIVHGATGGGWDWKVVAAKLTSKGHTVYRPTLTGLGEKSHLAGFDIRLTTHVDDVVNLVKFEQLNKVVLVGHSYGGMVITGVMDRIPDKIAHGIFLDAAAPDHGMSALDVWGGLSADTKVENGLVYFPWLEESTSVPKDVPHPYGTLTEKVSYDNPNAKNIHVTFVAFVPEDVTVEQRTQDPSWKRAKARGWTTITFAGDHVVYRVKPAEMAELLVESSANKNAISN